MKSSKYKLIISVFTICGVVSLLITAFLSNRYRLQRSKTLGIADFSSPIQVISNISSTLQEPDFPLDDPSGVAVDTDGNIYITDTDNHRLQIYNIDSSSWTIMGEEGNDVGNFYSPNGIAVDTNGNIYVADSGNNRIQKYDIGTTTWTAMGSEGTNVGQFNWPDDITIDNDSNIYVSDNNNSRIQKYDIGTTTWTAIGENGYGPGQFLNPTGIAVDSNNIYITDSTTHQVQKYNIGTTTWTVIGSQGTEVGQFDSPNAITVDTQGNIYITDRCNGRVQKYTQSLDTWSIIGSSNDICTYVSINKFTDKLVKNIKKILNIFIYQAQAQTNQAGFDDIEGITVDLDGNVYVADSGNDRIQKYDPNTSIWTAMGSLGTNAGQFDEPHEIDFDSQGNVYITDSSNNRVQKYDIGTSTWTIIGSEGSEIGQFYYPTGLFIDSNNNIYISDSDNSRIQKYDIGTTTWTTLGNSGAELGQFNWPLGISLDTLGNIYIADSGNDRIQKYDIGTTTWTSIGSQGNGVGQFNNPTDISIDTIGNIYIVDSGNDRIQRYDIGTTAWTILADQGSDTGYFDQPNGIKIDSLGNIYIADSSNHRIQKYDIEAETWSTIGEYNGPPILNPSFVPNGFVNKLANLFKNIIKNVLAVSSVYFNTPTDMAIDSVGNVYVVDSGNNRIQKLIYYSAPSYTISYTALENGSISGDATQSVSAGQSSTPVLAIGNEGYAFLQWSDSSIINPRFDIAQDSDLSITAQFTDTRTISEVDATKINTEISREFINIGVSDPTQTPSFTFNVNYTFLTSNISIIFPAQTQITPVGASTIDLTQFNTQDNTAETKATLSRAISSIKFGIPSHTLSFSKPASITIPVGSNYNNQNLQVKYQREGETSWNNETTCLILNGNCSFQTTHATTFVVLENIPQSTNNSSPLSYTQDYNCHSSKPLFISDLFQIDASTNKAKIYFTPQNDTSDYFISFSSQFTNAEEHGEIVSLFREGVQSHTIYHLKPNTTYFLKIRGQNGCMPGDWSNIMQFKTNSRIYYRYSKVTNTTNYIKKTTNTIKKTITNTWNGIILPKTLGD